VLLGVAACTAETGPSADAGRAADTGDRRGELLSYACQACHTLRPGEAHQIGPNLGGVFGRQAGSVAGFDFTDELSGSGIVWSEAELDRWLADPAGFLPGTTMAFTGYQSADDRAALISFLVGVTAD